MFMAYVNQEKIIVLMDYTRFSLLPDDEIK